ncbi:MAG: hypothetical protein SNJ71_01885 [Bacteroidales bacterium]
MNEKQKDFLEVCRLIVQKALKSKRFYFASCLQTIINLIVDGNIDEAVRFSEQKGFPEYFTYSIITLFDK